MHSPEPWSRLMFRGIVDGDGSDVAGFRGNPYGPEQITFEDQCRIIACVNACRGIPTEHLTDPECVIICVPKQFALNIISHIQKGIDNAQP